MANDSAQERNEQPTPRRLERAHREGQVAYSSDLTNGLVILIIALLALFAGRPLVTGLCRGVAEMLSTIGMAEARFEDMREIHSAVAWRVIVQWLPFSAIAFFTTLLAGGLLTGFRPTTEALKWDLKRIDPIKGFSRLFSVRSFVRGVIAVVKAGVVAGMVWLLVHRKLADISTLHGQSLGVVAEEYFEWVMLLMAGLSLGLLVIGLADYGFQKWKHMADMKMSRQEVLDERKDDEGDPQLKARLRSLQREASERSLVSDVESGTFTLKNPTHFAVVLKYEKETMNAPVVVAKGADHRARRIVEISEQKGKPVLERVALARALFHNVPVGKEIPAELYQAVAEVLVYLYRMERMAG